MNYLGKGCLQMHNQRQYGFNGHQSLHFVASKITVNSDMISKCTKCEHSSTQSNSTVKVLTMYIHAWAVSTEELENISL